MDIVKSDVFFFITTICIMALTIVLVALFLYGFRIIKDVRDLVRSAKEEGVEILRDIKETRLSVKEKGAGIISIIKAFFVFGKKRAEKKHKMDKKEDY